LRTPCRRRPVLRREGRGLDLRAPVDHSPLVLGGFFGKHDLIGLLEVLRILGVLEKMWEAFWILEARKALAVALRYNHPKPGLRFVAPRTKA
jgi:hypothetical protein